MHAIIFHLLLSHFIFIVSCTTGREIRGPYPQTCKHLCYQSLDPSKKCYCNLGFDGYCCGHYQVCCTCNEFYECNETKQACAKFSEDAYFPKGIKQSRIKNGTKTDYLPFQVRLKIRQPGAWRHCGGVLISNHLVLTAYHCLKNNFILKNSTVESGLLIPTVSGPHKQVRKILSVTKSNPLDPLPQKYYRDIAIVKVDKPFNLHEKYTFPACLPDHENIAGSDCFLSGWGQGSSDHLAVANFTIPVVQNIVKSCEPKNPARKYRDQFCAYSEQSGSASGDSGSPFICDENGLAVLHGIHRGHWKFSADKGSVIESFVFKHMEFIKMYMATNPDPCC